MFRCRRIIIDALKGLFIKFHINFESAPNKYIYIYIYTFCILYMSI